MNALTGLWTFFCVLALHEVTVEVTGLKTGRPVHLACWVSPWGWIGANQSVTVENCRRASCTPDYGLRYTSCPEISNKKCKGEKNLIPEDHLYRYGFPRCCPLRDCRTLKKDLKYKNIYENM